VASRSGGAIRGGGTGNVTARAEVEWRAGHPGRVVRVGGSGARVARSGSVLRVVEARQGGLGLASCTRSCAMTRGKDNECVLRKLGVNELVAETTAALMVHGEPWHVSLHAVFVCAARAWR